MENRAIYVVIDSYHHDARTCLVTTNINKAVDFYVKYWKPDNGMVIEVWQNDKVVYKYEAVFPEEVKNTSEIIRRIKK